MHTTSMMHSMQLLPFSAAALPVARCRARCSRSPVPVQAAMDRGGGNSSGSGGGLIMPGGAGRSKTAADIVAERQQRQKAAEDAPGSGIATEAAPGSQRSFRPPPGFLDATMRGEEVAVDDGPADTETMLNRLKANAGQWHDLARLLPDLARAGIDGLAVEQATGVERLEQSILTVAASVFDSLKQSDGMPEEVLAHFSQEGGQHLLYELRFLPVSKRAAPAIYMAENGTDEREAVVLARSVKEHERREGNKIGFSDAPGDCLAFKYYRDALETKTDRAKEQCVQKGLQCASTPQAQAKLRGLMDTPEPAASDRQQIASTTVQLEMVRFTPEELGVRPVAVAGEYGSLTSAGLAGAPSVSTSGAFGNFRIDAAGSASEWVPLPAWNIILLSAAPAVVVIPDCSSVPEIEAATGCRTDKDRARLVGQGLLVCSRTSEVDPSRMHLVAGDSGRLQLAAGDSLPEGAQVCAQVLFCCRPPTLQHGDASQTSELLQL